MTHRAPTLATVLAAAVLAGGLSPAASAAADRGGKTTATAAKASKGGSFARADGRKNH